MGFLRNLKGVFNSEVMGEEIVKSIIDLFYKTKNTIMGITDTT